MNASATLASRVRLRHCAVGANPIIWSNDDFAELGGDIPLERCLAEMSAAGYAGAELGHKFPRTAPELAAVLSRHGLRLVSGWHSTHLASRPPADEEAAFLRHLDLLRAVGANVIIVAECTRAVHGLRDEPLGFAGERPVLSEDEWSRVCAGLTHFAGLARAAGLRLVYHHHMGTVIQSREALDRLMENVPAMNLLFDPGHLAFAGVDPLEVLRRHGPRVAHVHLKNVRPAVVERARRENWSFCRAVSEGVFTIPGVGRPGNGSVDFPAVFARLADLDYRGWLVVEAEEDPAKAEPFAKARAARDYVRAHAGI
jgi:myo-inosose-2 dehydratase